MRLLLAEDEKELSDALVTGLDSGAELNVVWVYISYLRKKLNGLGSKVSIKATRGLGYSLENGAE